MKMFASLLAASWSWRHTTIVSISILAASTHYTSVISLEDNRPCVYLFTPGLL